MTFLKPKSMKTIRFRNLLYGNVIGKIGLILAMLTFAPLAHSQTIGISGTVYDDGSGLTDSTIDCTTINSVEGDGLWAYLIRLVDSKIIDSSSVSESGTYVVQGMANERYSLMLSTVSWHLYPIPLTGSSGELGVCRRAVRLEQPN